MKIYQFLPSQFIWFCTMKFFYCIYPHLFPVDEDLSIFIISIYLILYNDIPLLHLSSSFSSRWRITLCCFDLKQTFQILCMSRCLIKKFSFIVLQHMFLKIFVAKLYPIFHVLLNYKESIGVKFIKKYPLSAVCYSTIKIDFDQMIISYFIFSARISI